MRGGWAQTLGKRGAGRGSPPFLRERPSSPRLQWPSPSSWSSRASGTAPPCRSQASLAQAQAAAGGCGHFQGQLQSSSRRGHESRATRRSAVGVFGQFPAPTGPLAPWTPSASASSSAGQFPQPFSPAPLRPSGAKRRGHSRARISQGHRRRHLHRGDLGSKPLRRAWEGQERLHSERDRGDSCGTQIPRDLREGSGNSAPPLPPGDLRLFTLSNEDPFPSPGDNNLMLYWGKAVGLPLVGVGEGSQPGFKVAKIHSHHIFRSVLRCLFNFKSRPLPTAPFTPSTRLERVTNDFHILVVRGYVAFPLANSASKISAARKCVSHPTLLAQGQNIMCLKMAKFQSGLPSPTLSLT